MLVAKPAGGAPACVFHKLFSGGRHVLLSRIESLLQEMVKLPDGLQFIVFLPVCSASAPVTAAPRAANYTSIDVLIRLHGLDRLGNTAQRQVEIWELKISPIAKCFAELDKAGPTEPDGRPSSLTRLVLNVEVGEFFTQPLAITAASLRRRWISSR